MSASQFKGRSPGLLFGGLVAGALGLALAAGSGTSSAGTAESSPTGKYGSGMEGASSLPPNVTPGWKIRVCSERTKADQINFKISPEGNKGSKGGSGMGATGSAGSSGMGGSGSSAGSSNPANDASVNAALSERSEHTASWTRGEATEINLPSDLRGADRIRVEATPSQKDKKASVCLIYDDHVAKKLNFDDREVSSVKNTDNGECGC